MDSEFIAIGCLIVLAALLIIACLYLCTQAFSFMRKRIKRCTTRRLPHPRLTRNNTTISSVSAELPESVPCILRQNLNTSTSVVTNTSTSVVTERETIQSQSPVRPEVPPPPLPPRSRASLMMSPPTWTTDTPYPHNSNVPTQLVTLRQHNDEHFQDFQLPPRAVSLALQLRNPADDNLTSRNQNVHFIRRLNNANIHNHNQSHRISSIMPCNNINNNNSGRNMDRPFLISQNHFYRQTIAAIQDVGFFDEPMSMVWLNNNQHNNIPEDLPPTYEEAMRTPQQPPPSS